jgi:hypothetical protein
VDTSKLANWLQIVGNFGIVVGLILVAVQIDQTSDQVQQSINQARGDAARQLFFNRINNDDLRGVYNKVVDVSSIPFFTKLMTEKELTQDEVGMIFDEQFAWWLFYEQMIVNVDQLSDGQRHAVNRGLRRYADGWDQLWYATTRDGLNPDVVRYVDDLLAETEPPSGKSTASQSTQGEQP